MKKWGLGCLVGVLAAAAASAVQADELDDLRSKMSAARDSLVTMLVIKDKRGPDQQLRVKATAAAVSEQLAMLKPPPGKEAQFRQLIATWNAFRKTRESEQVPAILSGHDELARNLAGGVQKDRILRCEQLVFELRS